MMLDWFNAREAAKVGTALADEYSPQAGEQAAALEKLLLRADREVRVLRLNFYKKAKFANSFKWRLIENGVAKEIADELTQALVLHLSQNETGPLRDNAPVTVPADRPDSNKARNRFALGNKYFAQGAFNEAAAFYQSFVELDSRDADALNNLGAALIKLGNYKEAEDYFRRSGGCQSESSRSSWESWGNTPIEG